MTIEEELAEHKSSRIIFELLKLRAEHSYDEILDTIWQLQASEDACNDDHQMLVDLAYSQQTAY